MAQLQEARKSKLLYYIPFFPSVGLDYRNTVAPLLNTYCVPDIQLAPLLILFRSISATIL